MIIQKAGFDKLLGVGDFDLREFLSFAHLSQCSRSVAGGRADSGVKRGEAPELLSLPGVERVVVALSTLKPHSQKHARCRRGKVFRLELLRPEERIRSRFAGPRVLLIPIRQLCRQKFSGKFVIRDVVHQLVSEPGFEAGAEASQLLISFHLGNESGLPEVGEAGDVGRRSEKSIDHLASFIEPRGLHLAEIDQPAVVEEPSRHGDRRNLAGQVEVRSTQKLSIIRWIGRRDAIVRPGLFEQSVDFLNDLVDSLPGFLRQQPSLLSVKRQWHKHRNDGEKTKPRHRSPFFRMGTDWRERITESDNNSKQTR